MGSIFRKQRVATLGVAALVLCSSLSSLPTVTAFGVQHLQVARRILHSVPVQQPQPLKSSSKNDNMPTEDAAYEADRLAKDAQAMQAMKEESEAAFAQLRTPWKWTIRKRIWDFMEANNIARPPRPVHHRIPNFDGAEQAARRLVKEVPEYAAAKIVKVNPDTPQKPVRQAVLQDGKTLLTPQPRLRTGFFSMLSAAGISAEGLGYGIRLEDCTTSRMVAKYGTPVGLNEKYTVDLVVVGSTAVCPNTGARVGKGEGFAELEWGILSLQGNLDASTCLVVTTVHDEQVVDDMPAGQLTKHDVPVDIIVTPTRVIRVPNRAPKPSGVYWDLLSPQKLAQIRVLRDLKREIEQRDGAQLLSGPDEVLPPTASREKKSNINGKRKIKNKNSNPLDNTTGKGSGTSQGRRPPPPNRRNDSKKETTSNDTGGKPQG